MKRLLLLQIFITICCCHSVSVGSEDRYDKLELHGLLPRMGDVEGWLPSGEPQFAVGEDLYVLINGGAEIYHEYGFKEVVFQSYSTDDGSSINLEIYEMDSQEAAYGIYTFKTGIDGNPVEVGHQGWFESYYLNFWKGNYLVTITGLDTHSVTSNGIEKIAKTVDSKLDIKSNPPHITSYLPKENLQLNGITYLKGNLALFNQYLFDEKDIFGLKDGVVGEYDGYSIFIFQYGDQEESSKWYEFAKNRLTHSKRFTNIVDRDTQFEISDHRNNKLSVKHHHDWILIILGDNETNTDRVLDLLEEKFTQ